MVTNFNTGKEGELPILSTSWQVAYRQQRIQGDRATVSAPLLAERNCGRAHRLQHLRDYLCKM